MATQIVSGCTLTKPTWHSCSSVMIGVWHDASQIKTSDLTLSPPTAPLRRSSPTGCCAILCGITNTSDIISLSKPFLRLYKRVTYANDPSFTTAIAMWVAYGYEIQDHHDRFVTLAEETVLRATQAFFPGSYLVNVVPACMFPPIYCRPMLNSCIFSGTLP